MSDQTLGARIKERLRDLLAQPLESPEALLHEVQNHARTLEIVSKRKRPGHIPLTRTLASGLTELLEGLTDASPKEHRTIVQAACRYFAQNQPGQDHDLSSDSGLNDDVAVFQLAATKLGRGDLAERAARALKEALLDVSHE